jgi:hypothetical protein
MPTSTVSGDAVNNNSIDHFDMKGLKPELALKELMAQNETLKTSLAFERKKNSKV